MLSKSNTPEQKRLRLPDIWNSPLHVNGVCVVISYRICCEKYGQTIQEKLASRYHPIKSLSSPRMGRILIKAVNSMGLRLSTELQKKNPQRFPPGRVWGGGTRASRGSDPGHVSNRMVAGLTGGPVIRK
ncbi:hypothetical protein Btru_060861 [Bulinus truncatus]|nr:hypothetical protein Btru_060861 [Bulinus truncatus]